MLTVENLRFLDKLEAKKLTLNELLKKFDYLRKLEEMCEIEDGYIIADRAKQRHIDIDDENVVKMIRDALQLLQKKTRQEITELERQYFAMLD
ncbi:hypothetical protein Calow_0813 [Caldicellulosiruptor owensensis OL]|uniref:Uncharacterized protein n=1 Tax=Caldicellulosiruptor owensensis (strain ATCC 700167 / DSM 13100 / OL) TaxID=632518 RepID=E4Q607_CALOW|nr:hypothetical protein [Caldicellulosiruptor owensensis]ADQ04381.1 hypothetical protein Calow_0813 [Caldicellulosiruptor owensensis OL]